jgi:HEAT repeat protein
MDADSEMLRILGNMGSQDPQSRLEAVRYLGENGDDRAIQPLSLAFHQDESEDVRIYSRAALAKIITKTYYNFSQSKFEVFGTIAEATANKIFDEHVLDTNLSEGLKWLSEHGYR